jgi:hypothetical protein
LSSIHVFVSPMRSLILNEIKPDDPSELGWPPTLPVELALRTATPKQIKEAYGYTDDQWELLRRHPAFLKDLAAAVEMIRKEGVSFKMKARLQSEELLGTAYKMIHDKTGEVPPAVQADLLKFIVKVAGLDASKDQAANQPGAGFSINIQLG